MTKLIAIVGRPNVGKSRLFNRLTQSQKAIVHDYEGVTRDRNYGDSEWFGKPYTVIDTGGFVVETEEVLLSQMRDQAQLAIDEADVIMFMMDSRAGVVGDDLDIHAMLRETDKPVFYAVNKVDQFMKRDELIADFYQLGEELFPISAEHGNGIDALMDAIAEHLVVDEPEPLDEDLIKIAVVGKPNAGKSSIINRMLGEDRLLTSDIPGTTRDSIDTEITVDDQRYLVIDTAGLRRKRSISQRLEHFAVVQAIRSIDRADVALFVFDATQGLSSQDKKIASVIQNRGRGCVVVINKWDLVEKDSNTAGEFVKDFRADLPSLAHAPIIFVSAKSGQRVIKILPHVVDTFVECKRRVQTADLNRWLEGVVHHHSPPIHRNRRLKFYYGSQVAIRPPTFMFVVNFPDGVAPSYRRFLENQIRKEWGFEGAPVRTVIRARKQNEERT